MDSEALPTNQTTDEIVEERTVVNEEKGMNEDTISHPKEIEEAKSAVTETEEKSQNKNHSIVEDEEDDTEASINELFDSVVLSAQVVEEEAKPQQESDVSVSLDKTNKTYEEESKKRNGSESDTSELSPRTTEKAEGWFIVEKSESEVVKDQVVSELADKLDSKDTKVAKELDIKDTEVEKELEAKDPEVAQDLEAKDMQVAKEVDSKDTEVTGISLIPSAISETEDKKEKPILVCNIAESECKGSVEAFQDEVLMVHDHVAGKTSEGKIRNSGILDHVNAIGETSEGKICSLSILEDEMKVQDNVAPESIERDLHLVEAKEAGGASALEASKIGEKSDGGFIMNIEENVEEKIKMCKSEDLVKEVAVDGVIIEPPIILNLSDTFFSTSMVGTAEETLVPVTIIGTAEETTLPEVKITDHNQVTLKANSVYENFEISIREEFAITRIEIESLLETTCAVKKVAVDTVVNLIESNNATSGTTRETKIMDDKQGSGTTEERLVNQANEIDATEITQVSFEEENDTVTIEMVEDIDNSLKILNETHVDTTNLVKEDAIVIHVPKPVDTANVPQLTDATSATVNASQLTAIHTVEDNMDNESLKDDKLVLIGTLKNHDSDIEIKEFSNLLEDKKSSDGLEMLEETKNLIEMENSSVKVESKGVIATDLVNSAKVLNPKCADVTKVEEAATKQDIPAKSCQRRANNMISKIKRSIIKAKKSIMRKSLSSKNRSTRRFLLLSS